MDTLPKPKIIRIKRRRDDEPHDALVVESRRKRSRVSDLFEFVETVEVNEFATNPQYGRDLIARATKKPTDLSPSTSSHNSKSAQKQTSQHGSPTRRYTVLKPTVPSATSEEDKSIPKTSTDELTMYDAILDTLTRGKYKEDPAVSSLISGISNISELGKEPVDTATSSSTARRDEDNGFVVDVYLQRPMPVNWQMPDKVGWLTGLSSAQLNDSDSGTESPGDDDDEDSNTEDYYRNDYPDEDPDEDSDHHLSDYEEEYSEPEEEEEEEDDEDERAELRDLLLSKGIIARA